MRETAKSHVAVGGQSQLCFIREAELRDVKTFCAGANDIGGCCTGRWTIIYIIPDHVARPLRRNLVNQARGRVGS